MKGGQRRQAPVNDKGQGGVPNRGAQIFWFFVTPPPPPFVLRKSTKLIRALRLR